MKRFFLFQVLLVVMLFDTGCKHHPDNMTDKQSLKDSLIQQYLASADTLEFFDTTDANFQLLRAYVNNDTGYFSTRAARIKYYLEMLENNDFYGDCVVLPKLSGLGADEAYRLWHSQSFCGFYQTVTIYKKDNKIYLYLIEFSNAIDSIVLGKSKLPQGCQIQTEIKKELSLSAWKKLKTLIEKADYWGLKSSNMEIGFDGSSWRIDGYTSTPKYGTNQQTHHVSRWAPNNPAFVELGNYFMGASEYKSLCGPIW